MNTIDTELKEFTEYLSWRGMNRLEFLLYAVRARNTSVLHIPDLSRWPFGTTCKTYILHDEPWPIAIDLFEIYSPYLPEHYEDLLIAALVDTIGQQSALSWYLFDGVFGDVTRMFTQWQIERTYGVAWPTQIPQLAIRMAERMSPTWSELLIEARSHLYSLYPGMKTIYDKQGGQPE